MPDDTPLEIACVIGCAVQTGVGAVLNTAQVEPGATVLVLGLGGIGLSVVQGARAAGAAQIIASDPLGRAAPTRPPTWARPPCSIPAADDVARRHPRPHRRRAPTTRSSARASPPSPRSGSRPTRAGGTTVLVGAPPLDGQARARPAGAVRHREKKLMGCFLGSCNSLRDIPRMIAMWRAGQLDLEALVTARRPLDEINEAFADLAAGVGIRTVIDLPGA